MPPKLLCWRTCFSAARTDPSIFRGIERFHDARLLIYVGEFSELARGSGECQSIKKQRAATNTFLIVILLNDKREALVI